MSALRQGATASDGWLRTKTGPLPPSTGRSSWPIRPPCPRSPTRVSPWAMNVAFELPKGSSELGESSLDYEVTPELSRWAYWPDLYWEGYKLAGTAKYTGAFDVTYTVTDPTGSALAGPSPSPSPPARMPPESAPMNLTVDVEARRGGVIGNSQTGMGRPAKRRRTPRAAPRVPTCRAPTWTAAPTTWSRSKTQAAASPGRIRMCPDDMARTHSGPGMRAKKRSSTSAHCLPATTRPGSPG